MTEAEVDERIRALIEPFNKKGIDIEAPTTFANDLEFDSLTVMDFVAEIEDEFMQNGVNLLIAGHQPDIVRDMLTKDMTLTLQRHEEGQNIFKAIGDVGPAMGMIGTLIGLVQMLSAMDDPKQIGPAMAVALLTTLYGAILANMFALPVADKLALRSTEEKDRKRLIIDALLGIQEGQNPRVIESMLEAYLPKSARTKEES